MVTSNDGDLCKKKMDELSPVVLCGKDCNGLNVLHKVSSLGDPRSIYSIGDSDRSHAYDRKAAGLGHTDIARDIVEKYPETVLAQDNEGKTPLHYAAALKDDGAMYNLLVEHGADESKLDNVSVL